MKKRPVNLGRSDENIADQYRNIYEGIQKDAAQNSWDARATKKGKDWKLFFKYLPDLNILIMEDFGTVGMNPKRWMEYQSLWDTTKAEEDTLGARGQGKFLFHYFSADKLVLTETTDENGKYRFSFGTSEEWDDESKKLKDFITGARPLDHQGTKIWIMNVKQELRDELLDHRAFMKYIAATWWEIIRNYDVKFAVNFDGMDRIVTLPSMPEAEKEKRVTNERIGTSGTIRNLTLRYCKEEVPEEFRGIAIQRGGMTILRIPVVAEENIKKRIYGYCNFDGSLEMELKKCELPNHFGFTNKKPWNHVREYVRRKLDDFLLAITPKKEKIEVAANVLEEAVKLVNNLVSEYAPELLAGPEAKGGKGPEEPEEPVIAVEKPPVRIDIFKPNQKKFEYNETLLIDCEIANETSEEKKLLLRINIKHKEGAEKHRSTYNIQIDSRSRKKIDMPLIDFSEKKDKVGKYIAEGVLLDTRTGEEIHKRKFTFYLHEEPPKKGRAFIAGFKFLKGKKPDGSMIYFARWRNLPVTDKGIVYIVWDHPDFFRVRGLANTKRARNREILLYCARCGIDEAFRKLLELRYSDNKLDPDEIRKIKNMCDEMIYEAVLRTD